MSEFKQVGPTLDEINRANRDAWDSGEFKHRDDGVVQRRKEYHANVAGALGEDITEGIKKNSDPNYIGKAATVAAHHAKVSQQKKPKYSEGKVGEYANKVFRRPSAGAKGELDSAADVRHTPEGAQEEVRNGQVVSHHDSTIGERMDARVDAEEARHSGDAVHLPRTRKRTWKKPEWS